MQTIDRSIVGAVARMLILANGTTTTLDVKKELRQKGYWAKQDEVRNLMLDITENDGDICYTNDNGMYRTYGFQAAAHPGNLVVAAVPDDDVDDDLDDAIVDAVRHIRHESDNVPANYEVFDIGKQNGVTYQNVTRPQAKALYSKQYGVPFLDVRTKKLG